MPWYASMDVFAFNVKMRFKLFKNGFFIEKLAHDASVETEYRYYLDS